MRGYDRGEVQAFLLEVADDYENALRENDKLRQDVAKLDAVLGEHRGQERNLRNTLLTAQKLADEIKEQAQNEAAHHRARSRGPRRPAAAEGAGAPRGRAARDRRAAHEAARGRERHRALIRTLHNTLEFIREQDARRATSASCSTARGSSRRLDGRSGAAAMSTLQARAGVGDAAADRASSRAPTIRVRVRGGAGAMPPRPVDGAANDELAFPEALDVPKPPSSIVAASASQSGAGSRAWIAPKSSSKADTLRWCRLTS